MFESYADIEAHLHKLGLFHMDLTLGRMRKALKALDLEDPGFAVIQVAGTNGKGSTSSFLASIARAHGLKTGLFTSPHFVSPLERIAINGVPASADDWLGPARRIMGAAPDLTYFEFLTILALLVFRDKGVDAAVLEAGLGGKFDATTAVRADMVCFTSIDMDHEAVLGDTLAAIAADKAGAMRAGRPALSAPQHPQARAVLERAGREMGAELEFHETLAGAPLRLGLRGPHQAVNAGLAASAWKVFCRLRGLEPSEELIARGLGGAFIPGRFQSVTLNVPGGLRHMLLDGAHNPAGMAALGKALEAEGVRPSAVIFSCLEDKDLAGLSDALNAVIERLGHDVPVFVPAMADNPRAGDPGRIAGMLRGRVAVAPGLSRALDLAGAAPSSAFAPHLLCGSLYLLAEFYALYPHARLQSNRVFQC